MGFVVGLSCGGAEADHLTAVAVKPCCVADFVSRSLRFNRYVNPFERDLVWSLSILELRSSG